MSRYGLAENQVLEYARERLSKEDIKLDVYYNITDNTWAVVPSDSDIPSKHIYAGFFKRDNSVITYTTPADEI